MTIKPKWSSILQPRIVMETSLKQHEDSFEGPAIEPVALSLNPNKCPFVPTKRYIPVPR